MADVESTLTATLSQQRRAECQGSGMIEEEDETGNLMNDETDGHR